MQDKAPFWYGKKCFKIVLFDITHFTAAAMLYQDALLGGMKKIL
jgi:hypothetical protein